MEETKVCDKKTEVFSRVVGYFRPVNNWNEGKKEEFNERKEFNETKSLENKLCDEEPKSTKKIIETKENENQDEALKAKIMANFA